MPFRMVNLSLWSILLLTKISHLDANLYQDNPSHMKENASSLDEGGNFTNGDFAIQWNLNLGNQSDLLDSPFLKAGLEQSTKDFINLQLLCKPKKKNEHSTIRSLSIRKIATTTGKKQFFAAIGKCNGNFNACKENLQVENSVNRKKNPIQKISNNKNDPCANFEEITIFDFFEEVFISGISFSSNVELESKKQELKDALKLDFNVSFVQEKSDSLESVETVDMSVTGIRELPPECSSEQCENQKNVILGLFKNFDDELDDKKHECDHSKIMCDADYLVKYIRINNRRTDATLPESISLLPSLYGIFFEGEKIIGTIPTIIGLLTNLRLLWLQDNGLTGTIPSEIGNLKKLREFNLKGNRLRGKIPSEVTTLTKLRVVNLGRNFLQGTIPDFGTFNTANDDDDDDVIADDERWPTVSPSPTLAPSLTFSPSKPTLFSTEIPSAAPSKEPVVLTPDCRSGRLKQMFQSVLNRLDRKKDLNSNLMSLALYDNKLIGSIPSGVYNLHNLIHLNLANNLHLVSTISSKIGELKNLKLFDIHKNAIQGIIPSEIGNLEKLELLNVYENNLEGRVPDSLGNLKELKQLVMDRNKLSSSIPSQIGNCDKLRYLCFSENKMKGDLATELGRLKFLRHLDFRGYDVQGESSGKKSVGTLPTELAELSNWQYLLLEGNNMQGNIPAEYSNLQSTETLWLQDGAFAESEANGGIDAEGVSNISSIRYVNLDNYGISGSIPSILGGLSSLIYMTMANNALTGTIPTELGKLQMLEGLFLPNNQLIGPLPTELESLHRLKEFSAENNNLTGSIPSHVANMVSLEMFRIGNNQLTGKIPSEVGSMTEMHFLDLSNNTLSGEIPTETGLLSALWELNLSGNNLAGRIPSEIENMIILQDFNVGHNQLTGAIPSELGKIVTLRHFDVGENDLSGAVPMELGRFLFCSKINTINFGGNAKLSGTIPSGIKNTIEIRKNWGFNIKLLWIDISGTNITPDRFLCDLAEFDPSHSPTLDCDASSPSTMAPSPSLISPSFCIQLDILTDRFGEETSWKITDLANDVVVISDAVFPEFTTLTWNKCLTNGCYEFTIYDEYDEGMCCGWAGEGYYELFINNQKIFQGGDFGDKQEHQFCDSTSTVSPTRPKVSVSSPPTQKPSLSFQPARLPSDELFTNSINILHPNHEHFTNTWIAVDISESYIVIGDANVGNNKGELYLYDNERRYLRTIQAFDGNEGDWFARSLSIHNELIVIGAYGGWDSSNKGKAYVFHTSGDLFAELVPPDSMEEDWFGHSVGISDSHIVIGAPRNGRGKAYIYTTELNPVGIPIEIEPNDLGEWEEVVDDYYYTSDRFGFCLSISDGLIVIGAHGQDDFKGAAYIFNVMGQQIAKLLDDETTWNAFGRSVAIDEDIIVVGAPFGNDEKGSIYIYDRSGTEINHVMNPDAGDSFNFGSHVDVSNNYIAVRKSDYVVICNKEGKILAEREVPGAIWTSHYKIRGDVALLDDELVVQDDKNGEVLLMQHRDWDFPSTAPSSSMNPSPVPSFSSLPTLSSPPTSSSIPSSTPSISSAPSLAIFFGGAEYCSKSNPCGQCQGDCENDAQCQSDLVCYQRSDIDHPGPPGCGIPIDEEDYCGDLQPDYLHYGGADYCTASICGRCQGDCDSDADCQGDLVCHQRDTGDPGPPGCGGIPIDDADYCGDPF